MILIHDTNNTTNIDDNDTTTTTTTTTSTNNNDNKQSYAQSPYFGNGQMGSALMGSLQISYFSTDLLGTPVNLLLSSQKCQVVPFSPICQNCLLLQRPHH